ncbi:DNA internalization-related competence protein ComEC/Rec2 [Chitinibacter bivalviorum]|uniref:DNA internalization-related competence protein ComEC/Rec2 n=1 Tax=Chitinibacter bivalviorum TaxID=2739434 RepID=A0A7H9BI81_9NEIS|nr:DNA internalization-related competence protein ComEC/Rec2 [Chitinibacter bivalviorum]
MPQSTQYGLIFLFRPHKAIPEHNWQPDLIQVSAYGKDLPFQAGQRWQISAKLKPVHSQINPSGFDLESWFLQQNIAATATVKTYQAIEGLSWDSQILRWRSQISTRIAQQLGHHPYIGVIKALTIGDQNQIPKDQWLRFSQTGVTHLISISGLHITMLAGLIGGVAVFLWRRMPIFASRLASQRVGIIAGVLAAISYSITSGMSIPTQRTVTMLIIAAICLWRNQRSPVSAVWLLALSIVVLIDPFSVLSIGFWLSFLIVGILLWACAGRIAEAQQWRVWLNSQWAATLGSLPLLLVIFGQFPLISPLANAFAIPLVSLIVTPLALLGLIEPSGLVLNFSAQIMAWCDIGLAWCVSLPFASWQHSPPPLYLLPAAMLGVMVLLLPKGFAARYLGGVLLLPLVLYAPPMVPNGEFRLIALDVGQGLSVLIQTASHAVLFDTGQLPNTDSTLLPSLRSLNAMKLDALILSHNDNDHIGAAPTLLARWPIGQLIHSLPAEHALLQAQYQQHRPVKCSAGQHWQWDQVQFDIIWPSANYAVATDNAQGCVLRISNGKYSALITADIGKAEEAALIAAGLARSDILLVPHHGSKTSSSQPFISATQAQYAVFSAGFMNRFGHPKPEIIARYQSANATILRTDELGALRFQVGQQIQMQAERHIHPHYWYTSSALQENSE